MTKLEVLETWFQRVWADEDMSTINEMMVSETTARGLGQHPQSGPDEFRQFAQGMLDLISDVRITIDKSIEQDDWLHALITINAKGRKSGVNAVFMGQVLVRIVDGKIVDAINSIDFLSLYEQLGLLPENTFATCFGGQSIG